MARSLRDIRRKMKAIKSTRQVTKAMELVAASKMRRAVHSAQTLRRYALAAWDMLENLASTLPDTHPYLTSKPATNILAIVVSSDRGLCGSLNSHLFKVTAQYQGTARALDSFRSLDFIAVGKKGQQFLSRSGQNVIAAFPALSNHPTFKDVLPVTRLALDSFLSGTYDHVVLVYADFKSALVQEPVVNVLLPFSRTVLKDMLASLGRKAEVQNVFEKQSKGPRAQHLLEPSQEEILNAILPQLTEIQIYQAVLEAAASEHSARMVAMRNASDNASDILGDLTLTYNQTRQASITSELSELSAAKAALE